LQVNDELSEVIIKIEQILFTRKGEILGLPDFGCNLEDLVFSEVLSASYIENMISSQINAYCTAETQIDISTKVSFFDVNETTKGCLIDIYVNDNRVISALF
jgi:phage baseplate assembly protein W